MKIVTDSGADISGTELRALGITQVPLYIQFPDSEVDPAEISADDFYDRLQAMHPAIPGTAQPSSGAFAQVYHELAATDPQILSIHISSGLSGAINSARLGAEQAGPQAVVTFWDTLTLAGGQRFQVLAAAHAARAGWGAPAIEQRLAEIRKRADVIFTLDTLEYLARGGRIGRVQGLAGLLLNVKPIIHVDHRDGKYGTIGRTRSIAKALTAVGDSLHAIHGDTPLWVIVQHGRLPQQAETLAGQLRARLNIARLDLIRISPVLGVHTGPGIVGAAAVPMHLLSDLVE